MGVSPSSERYAKAEIPEMSLKYDSVYQTTVVPGPSVPYKVDWFKPDIPVGMLGYRPEFAS